MTAVLDGVSTLDFLQGRIGARLQEIKPEEWIGLVNDVARRSFGDMGGMYSIGELLPRIPGFGPGYGSRLVVVPAGAAEMRRAQTGPVPHGARFLFCKRLEVAPLDTGYRCNDLVFGKAYDPAGPRPWALYRLEYELLLVRLRGIYGDGSPAPLQDKPSGLAPRRITLTLLSTEEMGELFRLTDHHLLPLDLLRCLHAGLGVAVREGEERVARTQQHRRAVEDLFCRLGWKI